MLMVVNYSGFYSILSCFVMLCDCNILRFVNEPSYSIFDFGLKTS